MSRQIMSRTCDSCGDCVNQCQQGAIVDGSNYGKTIDEGACNDCGACDSVCPKNLIYNKGAIVPPTYGDPQITDECISCGACMQDCMPDAIRYAGEPYMYQGEMHAPVSEDHTYIAQALCTGCGLCLAHCAVDAIIGIAPPQPAV